MGRGSSGISGGRATTSAGGGQTPGAVEGDVVTLKVRGNDGESSTINISIQDMSQYEGQDVRLGQGNYSYAPIARVLAGEAVNNANDRNRPNAIDFPEGVEGKFTKTDKVPIVRNSKDAVILETAPGYVTKINGETVYLQKTQGGFSWNYAGMGMGGKTISLKSAKEDSSWAANIIQRNKGNTMLTSAKGQLQLLNKNHGKIDLRVRREMSYDTFTHIANR